MQLAKGEERVVTARFTAPAQNEPGMVEISLLVQGVAPVNAQSVEKVFIEIPVIQSATVTPDSSSMTALADGNKRTMSITVEMMEMPLKFSISQSLRIGELGRHSPQR
ncbi:MAG: hypothetical protein Ct9H90mP16_04350 [Candidatus Poseidoniales archaeon]|nr:MAG: hypothetical protein Ct9H90mP16_04350 [Candidatus Poseidoniales archaeon]